MISLVRMSLRLLLRNKGLWFFLLGTPILSAVVLNLKVEQTMSRETQEQGCVLELSDCTDRAVYLGDTSAFLVKVYDASGSLLSEYVLGQLAGDGMFSICRGNAAGLTQEEVKGLAKKDAFDDRAGILLYVKKDFEKAVLEGKWEQGIQLYAVSEDERQELFKTELTALFTRIKKVQELTGDESKDIIAYLDGIGELLPEKKIVEFAGKEKSVLTQEQYEQRSSIGYAYAIITLGFLFCGVMVAHSVIEEQNNRVFTRIMLTKVTGREYFLAKFLVTLLISLVQTMVLAVCLSLMPGFHVGIGMAEFLTVIFLLGLIFSTLSLLLGILLGDVMSSNYTMFAIWSISALLAGLYFPLDGTTKTLKAISYLMPQKWFMDGAELLLMGNKSAISMLICVTIAYLIVIISVGGVGLKIKRNA